jgi:hypothetical protein
MELNNIQFQYSPASGDSPTRTAQVSAMHGDQNVGNLSWRPGNGTVDRIWVHPEARRQGLAIGMMRHVQENYMPTYPNGKQMRLQHSPHRDPDGEKFAQATKGEFYAPPNLDAPRGRRAR